MKHIIEIPTLSISISDTFRISMNEINDFILKDTFTALICEKKSHYVFYEIFVRFSVHKFDNFLAITLLMECKVHV